MILEATRLWVDQCLTHATRGVNALLPQVPRCEGDEVPPPVVVEDWTRKSWVAQGDFSRDRLPTHEAVVAVVRGAELMEISVPGNPELRSQQPNVVLAAVYMARVDAKQRAVAAAEQDASYTMRAIQRATSQWIEETDGNHRTLAGCRLSECTDHAIAPLPHDAGRGFVGLAFVFGARMTDAFGENITAAP